MLRKVISARKFDKRRRDIETGEGQLSRQQQMVNGAPITEVYWVVRFRMKLSIMEARHKHIHMY